MYLRLIQHDRNHACYQKLLRDSKVMGFGQESTPTTLLKF